MVSNTNLLDLFEFLELPIHFNFAANIFRMLAQETSWPLAIPNHFELFPAPIYTQAYI
jgi:hypothetical protein